MVAISVRQCTEIQEVLGETGVGKWTFGETSAKIARIAMIGKIRVVNATILYDSDSYFPAILAILAIFGNFGNF